MFDYQLLSFYKFDYKLNFQTKRIGCALLYTTIQANNSMVKYLIKKFSVIKADLPATLRHRFPQGCKDKAHLPHFPAVGSPTEGLAGVLHSLMISVDTRKMPV